jgi:hypothetical protein
MGRSTYQSGIGPLCHGIWSKAGHCKCAVAVHDCSRMPDLTDRPTLAMSSSSQFNKVSKTGTTTNPKPETSILSRKLNLKYLYYLILNHDFSHQMPALLLTLFSLTDWRVQFVWSTGHRFSWSGLQSKDLCLPYVSVSHSTPFMPLDWSVW